jgi:hypothetical protein
VDAPFLVKWLQTPPLWHFDAGYGVGASIPLLYLGDELPNSAAWSAGPTLIGTGSLCRTATKRFHSGARDGQPLQSNVASRAASAGSAARADASPRAREAAK